MKQLSSSCIKWMNEWKLLRYLVDWTSWKSYFLNISSRSFRKETMSYVNICHIPNMHRWLEHQCQCSVQLSGGKFQGSMGRLEVLVWRNYVWRPYHRWLGPTALHLISGGTHAAWIGNSKQGHYTCFKEWMLYITVFSSMLHAATMKGRDCCKRSQAPSR
jgi:hypothetical protein